MTKHKMILTHWYDTDVGPSSHVMEDGELTEAQGEDVVHTNCMEIYNLHTGQTWNLNFLDKPNKWIMLECREPVHREEDICDGINEDQGRPICVILDRWEEETND